MNLNNIITDEDFNDFIDTVTKECSNYIKYADKPLFRGSHRRDGMKKQPIRSNRKLKDSHLFPYGVLAYNKIAKAKTGLDDFRSKTVYVTTSPREAMLYGDTLYYVFPTNKTMYLYVADRGMQPYDSVYLIQSMDDSAIRTLEHKEIATDKTAERFKDTIEVSRNFSQLNKAMNTAKERGLEVSIFNAPYYYIIRADVLNHFLEKWGVNLATRATMDDIRKGFQMVQESTTAGSFAPTTDGPGLKKKRPKRRTGAQKGPVIRRSKYRKNIK